MQLIHAVLFCTPSEPAPDQAESPPAHAAALDAAASGRSVERRASRALKRSPSHGKRFLMVKEAGADQSDARLQVIVVQDWFDELKRLGPAK